MKSKREIAKVKVFLLLALCPFFLPSDIISVIPKIINNVPRNSSALFFCHKWGKLKKLNAIKCSDRTSKWQAFSTSHMIQSIFYAVNLNWEVELTQINGNQVQIYDGKESLPYLDVTLLWWHLSCLSQHSEMPPCALPTSNDVEAFSNPALGEASLIPRSIYCLCWMFWHDI